MHVEFVQWENIPAPRQFRSNAEHHFNKPLNSPQSINKICRQNKIHMPGRPQHRHSHTVHIPVSKPPSQFIILNLQKPFENPLEYTRSRLCIVRRRSINVSFFRKHK